MRLLICPHAGGAPGFYRDLARYLTGRLEVWAVNYPGRERRVAEPLSGSVREMAEAIAEHIAARFPAALAIMGHSMGASIAHEVAVRLPEQIRGLVVSARNPPTEETRTGAIHLLSDDQLVNEVESMGATPPGVLTHPELRELLLPVIRNDYRMIETYRPGLVKALTIPTYAYVGLDDATTDIEVMGGWGKVTQGSFGLRTFSGGHFYFTDHLPAMADSLVRDVASCLEPQAVS